VKVGTNSFFFPEENFKSCPLRSGWKRYDSMLHGFFDLLTEEPVDEIVTA
jgi:hypothetical protein